MRKITLAGPNIETSCLGLGCASLGSRVSRRQGLLALARAHGAGVRWFDVAPAYGAGRAETILGEFLASLGPAQREEVALCTKVGLVPPPQGRVKSLARAVLRPAVAVMPSLRAKIRRSGVTSNRTIALTPELLRDGLERSLARLGVERVAVYALHNCDPADLARDDVLRSLEDLIRMGKAQSVAVAGTAEAALGAIDRGAPFGVVQLAQPQGAAEAGIPAAAAAARMGCIFHSVFGVAGPFADLTRRAARDPDLAARMDAAGYGDPAGVARLLLNRAFALNPNGIVLASMFSEQSLSTNLAAATRPIDPAVVVLCRDLGL